MRTMTIEAAIIWAVRDELPKVGADVVGGWIRASAPTGCTSPARAAATAGALGASIEARTNRFGVVPDMGALGRMEPHPAALVIGEALLGLDSIEPAGFAEWDAFADLDTLSSDPIAGPLLARARTDAQGRAGAFARMIGALSSLMVKRAVLGPPQGWDCGEVTAEVIKDRGKPCWFRTVARPSQWNEHGEVTATEMVEVDGFNPKTRRPYADAYRRHVLSPDPLLVALARAEWQLWRAALDVVLEDAGEGALAHGVRLLPSRLPMSPWLEPVEGQRVLSGGEAVGHHLWVVLRRKRECLEWRVSGRAAAAGAEG